MSESGQHLTPTIMLITLPLNLLSMPMRFVWFGFGAARFSVSVVHAMQIFNSVIWGAILGLVALYSKRER